MPSSFVQTMADKEKDSSYSRPSLTRDSTLEEDEPDNLNTTMTFPESSNTICAATPNNDLSVENQTKDATTPVVAAPLPLPPQSPKATESNTPSFNYNIKERKRASYRRPDKRKRVQSSNIGVVIGDFNGLYPDELSLKVGQQIEIISKDTVVSRNIGWWTGRNETGKIGIFPAACVAPGQNATGTNIAIQVETGEYPLAINSKEIEMKEVIGIGGFGKVHRAIYRGEEVAVKVAKTTTFDSLKAVQEVISEAEKFAHLTHENICALVGVVLVKDICLVMEYARGGALSDLLKKDVSLPIDIIINWATQIASGMHYLHHEVDPSLIHRDLKSSNILLTKPFDSNDLYENTMKISDFGLAREIEHTTHMSGAGTYPWMAPEVITSSDYSKKSDVWSFAVVLWELVTGERPYSGLNLYVVAYGVGSGTINLPIPDGCPEPLATLMNACWEKNYTQRPSFLDILPNLKRIGSSNFVLETSHEEFRTMQGNWKEEIQKRFIELKQVEDQMREREKEIERREKELKKRAEELNEKERIIKQMSLTQQQKSEEAEESVVEPHASDEIDGGNELRGDHCARPPRYKLFRIPKFLHTLWQKERRANKRNPLPDKVHHPTPRRMSNSPLEKKSSTLTRAIKSPEQHPIKRASLPVNYLEENIKDLQDNMWRGHRRNKSGDLRRGTSPEQFLVVGQETQQRSVPSSPASQHRQMMLVSQQLSQRPSPAHTKRFLDGQQLSSRKQRSCSDLRSPSPQQVVYNSPPAPSRTISGPGIAAGSGTAFTPISTAINRTHKPGQLGLMQPRKFSSQESSPSSPNVTITPAEETVRNLTDSGNNSMTCSEHSSHSNFSEPSQHPDMIKLDSPVESHPRRTTIGSTSDAYVAELDPLMTQSVSHDSLFAESLTTSPAPTPAHQIPQRQRSTTNPHISPKQSFTPVDSGIMPSPSIKRERPKGIPLEVPNPPHPISAPSSRPHSPKIISKRVSPTGSIKSEWSFPYCSQDSDPMAAMYFYQSDSDANSTASSLADLRLVDDDFPPPYAWKSMDLDEVLYNSNAPTWK